MAGSTGRNSKAADNNAPIPVLRTVKPRKSTRKPLPVVSVGATSFLAESGETGTLQELVDNLPNYSPTLFCAVGAADFVAHLTSVYIFRTPDTWQWRASANERSIGPPTAVARATRVSTAIHFFGWKRSDNSGYHKIIDPVTMYGSSLDEIWPNECVLDAETQRLVKLLQWGITLRDFCHENGMEIRPTLGSISAQFLTDTRFYPRNRRKVPATINARVREELPGNHYFLNVMADPSNDFRAYYLDQRRAHHYHALNTPLPDSNHCFAYGRFLDLEGTAFTETSSDFCGLYCLDFIPPKRRLPFDWIGKQLDGVFVYSSELQHLLDVGYRVRSVRAAWGSRHRDTGIQRYASWSGEQLDKHADAAWIKPLLLATYGVLAARPVNGQSIYRLAVKGTPVNLKVGRRQLNGLFLQSPRKLEPKIAFVLQRGMIEAATRSESIGFAQWLDRQGYTVLSIYADAVMVEANDDKPLPSNIPDPWRCKRELNHLQFVNRQAFTSDGMTKLPGVSREFLRYEQHAPGYAPRRPLYEAITGRKVRTTRRI